MALLALRLDPTDGPSTVTAGEVITFKLPDNVPISYLTDIAVVITGKTAAGQLNHVFGNINSVPVSPFSGTWNTGANARNATEFTSYGSISYGAINYQTYQWVPAGIANVTVSQTDIKIAFLSTTTFASTDFIGIYGVRVNPAAISGTSGANIMVNFSSVPAPVTNPGLPPASPTAWFLEPNLVVTTFFPGKDSMSGWIEGMEGVGKGIAFNSDGTPLADGYDSVTVTIKELDVNAWETKTNAGKSGTSNLDQSFAWTRIKLVLDTKGQGVRITGISLGSHTGAVFDNGQYYVQGSKPDITANGQTILIGILSQNPGVNDDLILRLRFGLISGLPANPQALSMSMYLDPPAPTLPGSQDLDLPLNLAAQQTNYYNKLQLKYKTPSSPAVVSIPLAPGIPIDSNLLANYVAFAPSTTSFTPVYDSGFSISNLGSSDDYLPVSSPGVITAKLFPQDGTGPYTVTTNNSALISSSEVVVGDATTRTLDTNGALKAKATYKVLLSQLLAVAKNSEGKTYGTTKAFIGFVRFNCQFPISTGIAFISDGNFNVLAYGYPMVSNVDGYTYVYGDKYEIRSPLFGDADMYYK